MEKNVDMLSNGLKKKAIISITKDTARKYCVFCGSRKEEKLRKCACDSVYYWKDHKENCTHGNKK